MKKLVIILLAMVLFVPLCVKADVAAPDPLNIEATVVNPDGAAVYDYSVEKTGEVIPAGEKVKILYNEKIEDKQLVYATYNKKSYLLDPLDLSSTEAYDLKKAYKVEDDVNYLLKDMDVYEGPSYTYKKIGTVKAGTIVEFSYRVDDGYFKYYEGEDVKGWIDAYWEDVYTNPGEYINKEKMETDCGTIKPETEMQVWFNAEYKRVLIANDKECSIEVEGLYRLSDEVTIVKLTEDTTFVDIEGKKYGLVAGEELDVLTDGFMQDPTSDFFVHFKVKDEDVYAWGAVDKSTKVGTKEREKRVEKKETKKEDKKESKLDTKTIILICVITAVVVALAAIVIIALLNKKKKEA